MLAVADLKGNHSIHTEAVYTFGTWPSSPSLSSSFVLPSPYLHHTWFLHLSFHWSPFSFKSHTLLPSLPPPLALPGQPRVGNQAFAMHLYDLTGHAQPPHIPTPYFRLVHYQDPIPHAPPVLLGFWHAPTEMFYNEDQTSYQVRRVGGSEGGREGGREGRVRKQVLFGLALFFF